MGSVFTSPAAVEKQYNNEFSKDDNESCSVGKYSDQKLPIDCAVECDHVLSSSPLKTNIVAVVEAELDVHEIYALVFLLYENVDVALQTVLQSKKISFKNRWPTSDRQLVWARNAQNYGNQVLTDWVRNVKDDTWQEKMEEALCIIQNYHVLYLIFGKKKDDMQERYLPQHPFIVSKVDMIRKCLYLMSDNLSNVEWDKLQREMNAELILRNPKACTSIEQLPNIPEVHMLSWMSHGLLKCRPNTPLDFSLLAANLKELSFSTWANRILNLSEQENKLSFPVAKSPSKTPDSNDQAVYDWNEKNPGVILIFNQEHFQNGHEDRMGTKIDFERLKKTFRLLNFTVKTAVDLTATEMIHKIEDFVKEFPEDASCFVIAILSHGKEGEVYASNTSVPIGTIRRLVQTPKLAGKPKLILIQACQGTSRLVSKSDVVKIEDNQESFSSAETYGRNIGVETDGPSCATADFCLFKACVPGFEAYRSTSIGSFFIQELCNEILLHGHEKRFEILATGIKHKLSNTDLLLLEDKTVRMVPEVTETLTKQLYLGVPKEHREAARLNVEERKKVEKDYEARLIAAQKELTNMPQRGNESYNKNRNITSVTSFEGNESIDQESADAYGLIRTYLDKRKAKS